MKKIKALVLALACGAALSVSAAGLVLNPQNNNQNSAACCDKENCCKDAEMSCCKAKKKGKNDHACCKDKDACCCKGDSCPMPNKKSGTSGN